LCKEAYRHLSAVHSGFAELTSKVEETGRCGKTQRELERRLEELEKQPVSVERVAADVKLVQAEIAVLEQQLGLVKVR
jgi:erythromycin esterase-like protein